MEPIPTICQGRIDNRDLNSVRSATVSCARNTFKQAMNRRNLVAVITDRPPYVIPFFCKPSSTRQFITTSKTGAQQLAGSGYNQGDILQTHLVCESALPERATIFSGRLQSCYVHRNTISARIPTLHDGADQLSKAFHATNLQNDDNSSSRTQTYMGHFKTNVNPQHVLFTAGAWRTLYGEWFCGCFVNKIKPVPGELRPNGK